MEILQLRYFFESAKNQSFSKTAEKYMVPLSSVSAAIKRLEKEFGCPLFERYSNRVELNENGQKLQNSLCIIFNELSNVQHTLAPDNTKDTREVKVGVGVSRRKITDMIIEYQTSHPGIAFRTIFDFLTTNAEDFDIIIDDDPSQYPKHEKFELFSRRIRLVAAANHPLCDKKIYLKQLCNQPFISFGEYSNTYRILLNACKREGFTPNVVVQTNDLLCYYKYVDAGIGIGIGIGTARDDTSNKIGDERAKFLNVIDFIERQTGYVFYKPNSAYGNILDFLNFLREKSSL